MNKQPQRTAKTKQALIDSFWDLYKENRIEKITIKEITSNAGFYRSTFYEYFGSVYDVLDEIENNLMEEFQHTIPQIIASQNIEEAFSHVKNLYERNGLYLVVLFSSGGDHTFTAKCRDMLLSTASQLTRLPKDDLQLNVSVNITISAVCSSLNYWYEHRDTFQLQEVIAVTRSILQDGLLPFLSNMGFSFLTRP